MEEMFNQMLQQMKELTEQLQYQSVQLQQQTEQLTELQEIIAAKDAQIAAFNGANRRTDPQEEQWEQLKATVERASEQTRSQEPEGQEWQGGGRSTGTQGKRHEDRPGAGRSHRASATPVQRLSPCRNLQAAVLRDAV